MVDAGRNQGVLKEDKPVSIGLYGFGSIAEAIAKRVLSADDIGGRELGHLVIYSSQRPQDLLKPLRAEFVSTGKIEERDLDKIIIEDRDRVHRTLGSVDVVLITGDNNKERSLDRMKIARSNITIVRDLVRQMPDEYHGLVGIVTNLPEILCYATDSFTKGYGVDIPRTKIFGMTHVDTERLRKIMANCTGQGSLIRTSFAVGVHGDVFVHSPILGRDNKNLEYLRNEVNALGKEAMLALGQTQESTAEAAYHTLCAIFNQRDVVVAATPYRIKELNEVIYLSLPVRFENKGASIDEESMGRLEDDVRFMDAAEGLLLQIEKIPKSDLPHNVRIPFSYKKNRFMRKTGSYFSRKFNSAGESINHNISSLVDSVAEGVSTTLDVSWRYVVKPLIKLGVVAAILSGGYYGVKSGYAGISSHMRSSSVQRLEDMTDKMDQYIKDKRLLEADITYAEIIDYARDHRSDGIGEAKEKADNLYTNELVPKKKVYFDELRKHK